ncbi:Zn(II)2Cys6 transcription factor [Aspergillus clavatus NRRL 1]|uniref:C6 zinc finger domain protein n=1 Tax=Aspergillus clavatus (strain ATCC 1007 / CBS 513.65 / DSM 816 / NCTC 3887 / NRRL 1 / QM 1276 / 107) TaxID=344612 RepID=A1CDV3_ASPCL|nr:C6 zinc finger domain protein [Aspergillus clavatus NRRL 1]EAW12030.1 C6 zinc finger domain protein [Aspergillus clavatus NRRL 1]
MPVPEETASAKPRRVLACVACQQRKIKCDRQSPCAHCVRSGAQCTTAVRQRRRRFPERGLLERLRHYETLLRQHHVDFDPLHSPPVTGLGSPSGDGKDSPSNDTESEMIIPGTEGQPSGEKSVGEGKSRPSSVSLISEKWAADPKDEDDNDTEDNETDSGFLHDNDDMRQAVIRKAYDYISEFQRNDHLLFGLPTGKIDLSASHPDQVQIFRLWQVYLDNVNPLLKVTHTPTLQARIIDAASDIANIHPVLEALMFSIYCVAVLSLREDECNALFKSPKKDLLTKYQAGCQQALRNCGVLRSTDRDSLTALYLYLLSIRPDTDPMSLSSLLGVAIRIAQRMGVHNDFIYGKYSVLDAEMHRRLWWSLILFDSRICEMSDHKTATLAPTWDCRTPLNVNDSELQPEMTTPPASNDRPTESLFAVVRSELADFVRHSAFHLDLTNPSLKPLVTRFGTSYEAEKFNELERTIEEKYLTFSNLENPLHYMTIWTMRAYLAKNRLLQHYARTSTASVQQTETQRKIAISHALRMLECDTNLMTSPLISGYRWFVHFHFPLPAYIHILQDLKRRPEENDADRAWEVMSNNYEVRFMNSKQDDKPFFVIFSRIVFQAWEARENLARQQQRALVPPRIVSDVKDRVIQMASDFSQSCSMEPTSGSCAPDVNDFSIPMQAAFGGSNMAYGTGDQGSTGWGSWGYPDVFGHGSYDTDGSQFLLSTMEWNPLYARSR